MLKKDFIKLSDYWGNILKSAKSNERVMMAVGLKLVNKRSKPIKTRSLYVAGGSCMDLFFEYIDDE